MSWMLFWENTMWSMILIEEHELADFLTIFLFSDDMSAMYSCYVDQ